MHRGLFHFGLRTVGQRWAGATRRRLACRSPLGSGLLSVTLLGVFACAPPLAGWDVGALEDRIPLEAWRGHRLGDATPYFAPTDDGLVLFLCRWQTDREIPISLPPDATPDEGVALRAALAAWQRAGIGVRFAEVPEARARIAVRFVPSVPSNSSDPNKQRAGFRPAGSGTTSADCALPEVPGELALFSSEARIPAQLVRAELKLRRSNLDLLGRAVPLSSEELAGAMLHELGHALGYPSHVLSATSIMSQSVDRVRRLGRRVMASPPGEFRSPTLGALYSAPSGVIVGRLAIADDRMAPIRRLAEIANQEGWGAPFARVGDRWARLWWVDGQGRVAGFSVPGIERGWKPDRVWIPTKAAREHLAR